MAAVPRSPFTALCLAFAALGLAVSACSGPSSPGPPASTAASSAAPSLSASASQPPSPSSTSQHVAPLTIYYVAVGDNGASGRMIGCGDSVVATKTSPVNSSDQVGSSIRALLSNHSRTVGQSGLVNVLYQSSLMFVDSSFDGATVTVHLTGQFMLAGECDIPRAKAQLEDTAITAAGATRAAVFVNDRPIDDVLSLK